MISNLTIRYLNSNSICLRHQVNNSSLHEYQVMLDRYRAEVADLENQVSESKKYFLIFSRFLVVKFQKRFLKTVFLDKCSSTMQILFK